VVKASANCFKEFFERTGAANRTRTCDPVITKGEFVGFVQFPPERSNALKSAS
jgi:hypothetical protein